jgi:hypothetical protein
LIHQRQRLKKKRKKATQDNQHAITIDRKEKDKIKVKSMNEELMMLYLPCFLCISAFSSFLSASPAPQASSPSPRQRLEAVGPRDHWCCE